MVGIIVFYSIIGSVAGVVVLLYKSFKMREANEREIRKALTDAGYTQIGNEQIFIAAPLFQSRAWLQFDADSHTFKANLRKIGSNTERKWRIVEESPEGLLHIVTTGEFAKQIEVTFRLAQAYKKWVQKTSNRQTVIPKMVD